jgi:hypothetical protein
LLRNKSAIKKKTQKNTITTMHAKKIYTRQYTNSEKAIITSGYNNIIKFTCAINIINAQDLGKLFFFNGNKEKATHLSNFGRHHGIHCNVSPKFEAFNHLTTIVPGASIKPVGIINRQTLHMTLNEPLPIINNDNITVINEEIEFITYFKIMVESYIKIKKNIFRQNFNNLDSDMHSYFATYGNLSDFCSKEMSPISSIKMLRQAGFCNDQVVNVFLPYLKPDYRNNPLHLANDFIDPFNIISATYKNHNLVYLYKSSSYYNTIEASLLNPFFTRFQIYLFGNHIINPCIPNIKTFAPFYYCELVLTSL